MFCVLFGVFFECRAQEHFLGTSVGFVGPKKSSFRALSGELSVARRHSRRECLWGRYLGSEKKNSLRNDWLIARVWKGAVRSVRNYCCESHHYEMDWMDRVGINRAFENHFVVVSRWGPVMKLCIKYGI